MRARAVIARRQVIGASALILVGCNMISGAEKLTVATDDDEIAPRERRPASQTLDAGGSSPSSGDAGSRHSEERGTDTGEEEEEENEPLPTEKPDASFDAATTVPPGFMDDFERPDGPTIGNGWFEKEDAFRLSGGKVVQDGNGDYWNRFVRRPWSEAVRDVQIELDFTFGRDERTDPTIYARLQPESDEWDVLRCYAFYATTDYVAIDREEGTRWRELAGSKLTQRLAAGQTYHFVFRVRGTDPVELDGAITTMDGRTVATVSAVDSGSKRITAAGPIGFGSGDGSGSRWDNVVQTDL